jgi:hypothetical protein
VFGLRAVLFWHVGKPLDDHLNAIGIRETEETGIGSHGLP